MYYHKNNGHHHLEENVAKPFLRGLGQVAPQGPSGPPVGGGPVVTFAPIIDPSINNPHADPGSIFAQVGDPSSGVNFATGDVPVGGWWPGAGGPVAAPGGGGGGGMPAPGYIDAATGAYVGYTYPGMPPVLNTSPIYGTYLCPDGSIAANGQPCKGAPNAPLTPVTPTVFTPSKTAWFNAGGPVLPSSNWFIPSPGAVTPSFSPVMITPESIEANIAATNAKHPSWNRHPIHARPVRAPRPQCRSGMMPDPNTGKCVSNFIQLSGLGAQKHPAAKHPIHPVLRHRAASQKTSPLVAAALLALFLL